MIQMREHFMQLLFIRIYLTIFESEEKIIMIFGQHLENLAIVFYNIAQSLNRSRSIALRV